MAIEFRKFSLRLPAGRKLLAALALASVACSTGVGERHEEDDEDALTDQGERAVLKFCNDLEKGGQDIMLTLDHVASGSEWLLIAALDEVRSEPTLEGGELKPEYRCSEVE